MMPVLNTFSIVAYDADAKAWGVAVASKFLAAAALVSWARAGAGAVATQALARVSYGPMGLNMLEQGLAAQDVLDALLADDPEPDHRQVGLVDVRGEAAAYTGPACSAWAGHRVGKGYACQGNILAGAQVLEAMAAAYERAPGELADRLVAALRAAEDAGGDRRGKQSAGVLVVRAGGGYGGDNDRYLDLRVDDDAQPVARLATLVSAHHLFFGAAKPEDQLPITPELAHELQTMLHKGGYITAPPAAVWDAAAQQAFWALVGVENLEERWNPDGNPNAIDRVALDYLRGRFG